MYLPAIAEGLGVTFRHFVKNFFGNVTGQPREDRHRDDRVPRGEEGVPGALPRPAPPDAARRRPGPLRRLHDVPDRLPRPLHHHRPRGGARRHASRSAPRSSRSTSCAASSAACASRPARATRSAWTRGEHAKPTYRRVDAHPRQGRADVARHRRRPPCRAALAHSGARRSRASRRRRRPATSRRRSARRPDADRRSEPESRSARALRANRA